MADLVTRIYLALPPPLKNLAATLQGYRLVRWRYGAHFRELVPILRARETWDEERWRAHQLHELQALVARAIARVPYYREAYGKLGLRAEDLRSLEDLAHFPLTPKADVREAPERFVADDVNRARMIPEHTSGSTGTPTRLWWSHKASQASYAFMEARIRNWAGIHWGQPWAMLGGQMVVPVSRRKPPYWIWSRPYHQLYMSVYHISADTAPRYLEAIARHKIEYLYGYASGLYSLASSLPPGAGAGLGVRAVFSNAEPLFPQYRDVIAAAFGCPVYDTFSSAEMVFFASECRHRSMHVSPDFGIVESLVEPGEPADAAGELIGTGLLNRDMPLIRYRTGDRIALAPGVVCACGRRMPVIREVLGRSNDLLQTPDGRRVYLNMTAVGKWAGHIREFQVEQDRLDHVVLRVIPGAGYQHTDGTYVQGRIQERLGVEVRVDLQEVTEIARTAAGKFRAIVSSLPGAGSPTLRT